MEIILKMTEPDVFKNLFKMIEREWNTLYFLFDKNEEKLIVIFHEIIEKISIHQFQTINDFNNDDELFKTKKERDIFEFEFNEICSSVYCEEEKYYMNYLQEIFVKLNITNIFQNKVETINPTNAQNSVFFRNKKEKLNKFEFQKIYYNVIKNTENYKILNYILKNENLFETIRHIKILIDWNNILINEYQNKKMNFLTTTIKDFINKLNNEGNINYHELFLKLQDSWNKIILNNSSFASFNFNIDLNVNFF
jgi:hypothetical protein